MLYSILEGYGYIFYLLLFFNILSWIVKYNNILISYSLMSFSANLVGILYADIGVFFVIILHFFTLFFLIKLVSRNYSHKLSFIKKNSRDMQGSIQVSVLIFLLIISVIIIFVSVPSFSFAINKEAKITAANHFGFFFALSALYVNIIIPAFLLLLNEKKLLFIVFLGLLSSFLLGSGGLLLLSLMAFSLNLFKIPPTLFLNGSVIISVLIIKYDFNLAHFSLVYFSRIIENGVGSYLVIQDNLILGVSITEHLYSRFFGSFGDINNWAFLFSSYGRWSEFGGPNESVYALAFSTRDFLTWLYISLVISLHLFYMFIDLTKLRLFFVLISVPIYSLLQDSTGSIRLLIKAIIIFYFVIFISRIITKIIRTSSEKT